MATAQATRTGKRCELRTPRPSPPRHEGSALVHPRALEALLTAAGRPRGSLRALPGGKR